MIKYSEYEILINQVLPYSVPLFGLIVFFFFSLKAIRNLNSVDDMETYDTGPK